MHCKNQLNYSNSKNPTNRGSFIEIKSIATHARWNVIHMKQSNTQTQVSV